MNTRRSRDAQQIRRFRQLTLAAVALALAVPLHGIAQVDRKGFVLNLGLGAARVTTSRDFGGSSTAIGVGTDFKIGYAPSDQLLIFYSNDAAFHGQETNDDLIGSGMSGVGATYFIGPEQNALYVSGSIGVAARNVLSSSGSVDAVTGTGFSLGGGYEFARHWLLDAEVVKGSLDGMSFTTLRAGLIWLLY